MSQVESQKRRFYNSRLRLISLITVLSVTFLFSIEQRSWADIITCPSGSATCNGTSADDIIVGTTANAIIHGLGGNDYIVGTDVGTNFIYGDDGNDMLIGGQANDVLQGGKGDDKYDGGPGGDTILEGRTGTSYIDSNDIISGSYDNDYIEAGGGADQIFGGPGNDNIILSPLHRDFASDFVDCGVGSDSVVLYYRGDSDRALPTCEQVNDNDL